MAARAGGDLAGVLVVANPTLNGAWRREAWPRLMAGADKREAARVLNARVRTIARVVVEPRYRGLGVAKALVRAYLRDPCTDHTEALAAMGAVCPFFAGAGMREVPMPARPRERMLARQVRRAGVRAWELLEEDACARILARSSELRKAMLRFARQSRATRGLAREVSLGRVDARWVDLAARAGSTLVARPRVYVCP